MKASMGKVAAVWYGAVETAHQGKEVLRARCVVDFESDVCTAR